jgi:iduronate 2-sulfatase
MTSVSHFGYALVAGVLALAVSGSAPAGDTKSVHPNVLFVVVDDLNTEVGCYGNRIVKSPNMDRLAARGVRFDRAYCQYPLCNPSRVSFMSGRRPETTGVYVLNTSPRKAVPEAVMLPQLFRQHGYFAAGAGKVYHSLKMSDPESWDFYEDGAGDDPQEKEAIQARYGGGDGRPAWHVLDGDGSKTRDGLNARTIARFVEEKATAGKPFFLAAGFHKPHLPWTAPKRFFDLYPPGSIPEPQEPPLRNIPEIALQTELAGFAGPATRTGALAGYFACISFTDDNLGLLFEKLDRLKLWDNTVVVLLGDNGFHLGDHSGLWSKHTAFEHSVRVPLIVAAPGIPPGKVVSQSVELLDVYPTLAELCSLPVPPGLEGHSLTPLMKASGEPPSRPAFTMVYHYNVTNRTDVLGRSVKTAAWRYTEWDGGTLGRELYLHKSDPYEYDNQAASTGHREELSQGQALLRDFPMPKPGPTNRPRALLKAAPEGAAAKPRPRL